MKIIEKITLDPQDVRWIESDVNYSKIYFNDGKSLMVAYTLKIIEERVKSQNNFIRIHRSYLVNKAYIKSVSSQNKEIYVRLTDDLELLVSRRKRRLVKGIPRNKFAV